MWFSEKIPGDDDKANTDADSTDGDDDDDSRVDDDDDENEDFVKEFENGETLPLFLICCSYINFGLSNYFCWFVQIFWNCDHFRYF